MKKTDGLYASLSRASRGKSSGLDDGGEAQQPARRRKKVATAAARSWLLF